MRQLIIRITAFFWGLTVTTAALAGDWSATPDNVAIGGYDPVSYFSQNQAQPGQQALAAEWDGVTWYFSSPAHRELFLQQPEQYAPQFGGYCANGLSDGHKVPANPQYWRIIDNRLYLFFSRWGRAQWALNVSEQITLASRTWEQTRE